MRPQNRSLQSKWVLWMAASVQAQTSGYVKVGLRVVGKVLDHLTGVAVGEEESNIAVEMLGKLREVGEVLFSWGESKRFRHYFGLSEEESARSLTMRAFGKSGPIDIPAIGELLTKFLEVGVAHVLYGEDKDVLKIVRRFLDIGKELQRQLLALLVRLGKMYDLRAL